ncbi:MAG: PAS domain S-box protein, partial [Gammaproteobacteria bacterium]
MSTVLALLVWSGWEQYSEFHKSQIESMQRSSWSAANEISNYVEMMQNSISMFADNETKLLVEAKQSETIQSFSIKQLNKKISNSYPDAINFLIWDKEGKLVIDAEGTQKNKPEVYILPSIGQANVEYAVRMHHNSEYDHFDIIVSWNHDDNFMGVFGISFPSELVQPLLYKHQNNNHKLVLWRQDSPGFIELATLDSNLELANGYYLEPEDMERVGAVASIGGTQWDVVSLHNLTLFTDKLTKIVINGLLKFLAIFAAVVIAARLYQMEARRRYEANEKIRKTEERLRLALERTQDGVWEIDLGKDEYYFDERWCELVGYSTKELQPNEHPRNRLIHKEDLQGAKQALDLH